jgi:hypothetical protein
MFARRVDGRENPSSRDEALLADRDAGISAALRLISYAPTPRF